MSPDPQSPLGWPGSGHEITLNKVGLCESWTLDSGLDSWTGLVDWTCGLDYGPNFGPMRSSPFPLRITYLS